MSEITVGGNAAIIAAYDIRAAAVAAATRLRAERTLGNATQSAQALSRANGLTDLSRRRTAARSITLELTKPANNPTLTPGFVGPPVPSAPDTNVMSITLSIANADGFAQRISISSSARQSVHQTVVGNYVDEWGIAVGQLDLDVTVLYGATPGSQIQSFFDLLEKAKRSTPLSIEGPSILRFHDAYLQRSFIITQDSVRFEETAEKQNHARLTISAQILHDYGTDQFPIQKSTQLPPPRNLIDLATNTGLQFG